MSRLHDAGLATSFLGVAVLFGTLQGASVEPAWILGGATATVAAEGLAYRRPEFVRDQFERRWVLAASAGAAGAAIGAGSIVAPDRSLSVAVGALGTYLLLLGAVAAVERPSGGVE